MGRNPSWPDVNATFFRSSLAWKLPAGTVTFAPSTSSTYEAIGTVSGMQPASNGRFVTVRMRSDAVYNISFDVPENKTMPLYDSSGYLLDVNKNSLGLYLESYNPTQIKSFKPEYSGLYYISIVSSSRTDNAFLALTVTEDIGGDSKNTPETVVDSGRPIYRFFNMSTGTHFFTSSEGERDNIYKNFNNFSYEGAAFNAATATTSDPITVYRFFNKRTGTHFFTSSEGERDNVIANSSDTYSFEGEAYKALSSDSTNPNAKSLYRFFNKTNGTHFYTASEVERDSLIKTSSATYNFEGIAYKVLDSTVPAAGAPVAQAAAMPPQGEAALQSGVVDAAPIDLKAVFGGLQAAEPQTVTFDSGAFTTEATGGFAALFPQQRSDWAAMFAA